MDTELFATNGFLDNEETKKLLQIVPQLKAVDVADAVWYAINAPAHVQVCTISEILFSLEEHTTLLLQTVSIRWI